MPNHISTILEIRGNDKLVADCIKFVSSSKKVMDDGVENTVVCPFDCNTIAPMPEELRGITSPVKIVSEEEYEKAVLAKVSGDAPFVMPLTKKLQAKYIEIYGSDNWYDWAVGHWGTKWGAYDHGEWSVNKDGKNSIASLFFQSAWSPVVPVVNILAWKYPLLNFTLKYADEGGGFLGYTTWADGEKEGDVERDWDSEEGIALREELGVYYPEDEEEPVDEKPKKKKKAEKVKEEKIKCASCDNEFDSVKDLENHFSKKHLCQICAKVLPKKKFWVTEKGNVCCACFKKKEDKVKKMWAGAKITDKEKTCKLCGKSYVSNVTSDYCCNPCGMFSKKGK